MECDCSVYTRLSLLLTGRSFVVRVDKEDLSTMRTGLFAIENYIPSRYQYTDKSRESYVNSY